MPGQNLRLSRKGLAVKFQPVGDLVDHLALGTRREAYQIELGALDKSPAPQRR
jgi:hypothetical protein